MMITLLIAFAVGIVLGKVMLPVLHKLKFGQNIYELAPEAHKKKQGTPTMGGLVIAFKDYKLSKGIWGSKWVGMKFFEQFLSSPRSMNVFRNTICISIIKLGFGFFIPIIFAMLLNEVKNRPLLKITQTVSYMPHFLSWSICTLLFTQLLSPDGGALMTLGSKIFGYEPSNLFANPRATWPLSFFTEIWKETGWNSIIYLAALSGIPAELYEAAELDGASKWQQTKYITIPTLRPIISIMFIMAVGNIFRSDFGLFYQATRNSGSLTSITQTIDVYVYKALLERPNINLSSAAALLQSVCGCLTIVVANIVVKKIDPEAGLF